MQTVCGDMGTYQQFESCGTLYNEVVTNNKIVQRRTEMLNYVRIIRLCTELCNVLQRISFVKTRFLTKTKSYKLFHLVTA